MGTGKRRISSADVVRVAPVVPAVRAALAVSEDPVDPVVRVALAVSEDPVEPAVSENPAVPELAQVEAVPELAQVEAVPELAQVEAVPVPDHPRVQLAVALRTKSVTAAHRPDLVPLLAEEDFMAVAETTREPAVAEAVIAWGEAVIA
jgi:hypothetical protein